VPSLEAAVTITTSSNVRAACTTGRCESTSSHQIHIVATERSNNVRVRGRAA